MLYKYNPIHSVIFLLLLIPLAANGQVNILPVTENTTLATASSPSENRNADKYYRLFMVSENETIQHCIDTAILLGVFDKVINLECRNLDFGSVEINSNCFTYSSGTVSSSGYGYDTICLQISTVAGFTRDYNYVVKITKRLTPPLMDDFAADSHYPDPALWLENDVYINTRLGVGAPSIGVATFDGLDANGAARGGGYGGSDTLTSNLIDLSGYTSTSNVFLSYYLQEKGLGIQPLLRDSMVLEFKNADGNWERVKTHYGDNTIMPGNNSKPFGFFAERIGLRFLHKDFQFRFYNYCNRRGLEGLWHLDYVRISDNEVPDGSFHDVALTQQPLPVTYPYYAVPMKQFRVDPASFIHNQLQIGISNHFPLRVTVAPSDLTIEDALTQTIYDYQPTLLEVPPISQENQRDLESGNYLFYNPFNTANLLSNLQPDLPGLEEMKLRTIYKVSQSIELGNNFPPTLPNNSVHIDTDVSDYFAYDDGSAERVLVASVTAGAETRIAIEFNLLQPDTLRGIRIHFPRYGNSSPNTSFDLFVYEGSLDSEPIAFAQLVRPLFGDEYYDELNAFSTYVFKDNTTNEIIAIPITSGNFYIGWAQKRNSPDIAFGYDTNTDTKDKIYYNEGFGWNNLADVAAVIPGTVMMRPVFGSDTIFQTNVTDLNTKVDLFEVYPNPTTGFIQLVPAQGLRIQYIHLQLFNEVGQLVFASDWSSSMNISALPAGVYYLRATDSSQSNAQQIKKIILH